MYCVYSFYNAILPSAILRFLLFCMPCLQGILSLICFVSQTWNTVTVYVISKWSSWIFKEALAFCFCLRYMQLLLCFPLDRNEVTKLKFEGKTFHIYANQKEVRAWISGCWEKTFPSLLLSVSRCYIVLHNVSFPTCRTKRSSWHTLPPHQRHASTFGSVELRIKLFTSESTNIFASLSQVTIRVPQFL